MLYLKSTNIGLYKLFEEKIKTVFNKTNSNV